MPSTSWMSSSCKACHSISGLAPDSHTGNDIHQRRFFAHPLPRTCISVSPQFVGIRTHSSSCMLVSVSDGSSGASLQALVSLKTTMLRACWEKPASILASMGECGQMQIQLVSLHFYSVRCRPRAAYYLNIDIFQPACLNLHACRAKSVVCSANCSSPQSLRVVPQALNHTKPLIP